MRSSDISRNTKAESDTMKGNLKEKLIAVFQAERTLDSNSKVWEEIKFSGKDKYMN